MLDESGASSTTAWSHGLREELLLLHDDDRRTRPRIYRELVPARTRCGASKCSLVNVTGHSRAFNLAGPPVARLLAALTTVNLSDDGISLPRRARRHRRWRAGARLLRVGFVGELGYEIHVPAGSAQLGVWDALIAAGRDVGIRPFRRRSAARAAAREGPLHHRPGHGRPHQSLRGSALAGQCGWTSHSSSASAACKILERREPRQRSWGSNLQDAAPATARMPSRDRRGPNRGPRHQRRCIRRRSAARSALRWSSRPGEHGSKLDAARRRRLDAGGDDRARRRSTTRATAGRRSRGGRMRRRDGHRLHRCLRDVRRVGCKGPMRRRPGLRSHGLALPERRTPGVAMQDDDQDIVVRLGTAEFLIEQASGDTSLRVTCAKTGSRPSPASIPCCARIASSCSTGAAADERAGCRSAMSNFVRSARAEAREAVV